MQVDEHLAILEREGALLAAAAERTPPDASVPTCPDWTLRDLVRHVGGIHRWAAAQVSRSRSGRWDPFAELDGHWPSDASLVDWFREGHAELVGVLREAPADLECFTFLPAPSPRAFWARRQAHETGMHRVDAESASGQITPFAPDQAVDGVEELLFGFMARPGQRLKSETPQTLLLDATDTDESWVVRVGPDEPRASREPISDADCKVRAAASDLFQLVWNRRSPTGLDATGDLSLLDLWRESVFVRWG
jgi:uncharacterized protein (TIGR03083 family)